MGKLYAGEIKETANGRGCSVGRQERRTQEIFAQRRIQGHVRVDEQS